MNMRILVESLDEYELNSLANEIHNRRIALYKMRAKPITGEMIDSLKNESYIGAIKLYRMHYGASLLEAKTAIDAYREMSR